MSGFVSGADERLHVLGEAGAAIARAGVDEAVADARIGTYAHTDFFDVGSAALGDKTVLDTIDAAARALDSHPEDSVSAVITAVDETLALFRDRECKIGRARIFADRSVGLDDPGMVAFRVMVGALKRN